MNRSMVSAVYRGRAMTADQAERQANTRRSKADRATQGRHAWENDRHQTGVAMLRNTMRNA